MKVFIAITEKWGMLSRWKVSKKSFHLSWHGCWLVMVNWDPRDPNRAISTCFCTILDRLVEFRSCSSFRREVNDANHQLDDYYDQEISISIYNVNARCLHREKNIIDSIDISQHLCNSFVSWIDINFRFRLYFATAIKSATYQLHALLTQKEENFKSIFSWETSSLQCSTGGDNNLQR